MRRRACRGHGDGIAFISRVTSCPRRAKRCGSSWQDRPEQCGTSYATKNGLSCANLIGLLAISLTRSEMASIEEFTAERADLFDRLERARKAGADEALAAGAALTVANERMQEAVTWHDEIAEVAGETRAMLPPPDVTAVANAPAGASEVLGEIAARVDTAVSDVDAAVSEARPKLDRIREQWKATRVTERASVERRLAEAGITNAEELAKWQARLGRLDSQLKAAPERKKRLAALDVTRQQQLKR